jgi:sarcosine oxidase subunit beta
MQMGANQTPIYNLSIIRTWSGVEGYVADGIPVMGESATTPGLFHAFGFCGHGFQLGPGVGDVMASLIVTGQSPVPIGHFDIQRFAQAAPAAPRVN